MKIKFKSVKIFLFVSVYSFSFFFSNGNVYSDEELFQNSETENLQENTRTHKQIYFPIAFSVSQTEGRYLGNDLGFTSFSLFASRPTYRFGVPFVPFVDLNLYRLNNGKLASNLGAGFRFYVQNIESIFGANIFYDTYQGDYKYYHQLGIGLEFLLPCFNLRLNGHVNIGQTVGYSKTCVYDNYVGGYLATSQQHQASMQGFELEVGRWITRNAFDFLSVYASIGPYFYFSSKHSKHKAYGGQARLLAYFNRYLSFELRGGYDPFFHSSVQGTIRLTIPFDLDAPNFSCIDLIYQPVQRQRLIVLDPKRCCWTFNWDDNL